MDIFANSQILTYGMFFYSSAIVRTVLDALCFGLSVCPSERCMPAFRKFVNIYLIDCFGEFHQLYYFGASAAKDYILWLKGQGHDQNEFGKKFTFVAIYNIL